MTIGMKKREMTLSHKISRDWKMNKYKYLLILPVLVYLALFCYKPMYGLIIAFNNYKPTRGITGSEWVGLYWFERFFTAPNCVRMIKNTVLLSLYSLLWSFPIPIILSLCINQLRFAKFKRVVQTVLYAPHFISTMVICGMIKIFLSPSGGLLNLILGTSVDFLSESAAFRTIYVASGIWQEAGWGTIIYLASITGIDQSLYEAATIDGANRFHDRRLQSLAKDLVHHPPGHRQHDRHPVRPARRRRHGGRLRPGLQPLFAARPCPGRYHRHLHLPPVLR